MEQFLKTVKILKLQLLRVPRSAIIKACNFLYRPQNLPYCRKFGTLAGVVAETKAHIYFINS